MSSSVCATPWVTSPSSSRCSVLLDPIPSVLLDTLVTQGSCHVSHEWEDSLPMISDNEVQGLLQDLVDEDDDVSRIDDVATTEVAPPRQLRRRPQPEETKRRKRSTSSSSSACSRHRHKHRRRRRHESPPPPPDALPPRPRVNPIFVWVKQDNARIVEVHCEEYDKRNRIRLTKTSAGWRAIPRTERCHVSTEPASPAPSCREHSPEGSTDSVDQTVLAEMECLDQTVLAEMECLDQSVLVSSESLEQTVLEPSEPECVEETVSERECVEQTVLTPCVVECLEESVPVSSVPECVEQTVLVTSAMESVEPTVLDKSDVSVDEQLNQVEDTALTETLTETLTPPVEDSVDVGGEEEEEEEEEEEQAQPTDLTLPKSASPRPPPRTLHLRPPPPHFLEALLTSPSPCPPPAAHAAPTRRPVKRDDDITLRNLLSRRPRKVVKEETVLRVPTSRKSRLLELLTAESRVDQDPLAQLKKILSDPDMAIPDPLLVPRDRLQELVTCPAKEIPRLLTLRPELRLPEALAYPGLLQDPNLLVVSISYLQSLLRSPDKGSAQPHSNLLQWQQEQALSQMMWLPYLNQLEAQAMFNNSYPLMPDVHAMAMWQEAMMAGMMPPPPPPQPPPPLLAAPGKKRCSSARTTPLPPGFHPYLHPPKTEVSHERCRPTVTCKPLLNLLSSPRREEGGEKVVKLKVKEHLVDPTLRPKLLKQEVDEGGDDKVHANLWHPLFGSSSQKAASYSSPWQWTTVTVNGE